MPRNGIEEFSPQACISARMDKDWSAMDLAIATGLHYETIRSYEGRGMKPSPESLRKLAGALECRESDLLA